MEAREMKMCAGSWHAWIDNAYASHDKAAQKCYEQAVEEWTLDSRNYKDCKHCPWNLGLGLSQACGRECRVNKGGGQQRPALPAEEGLLRRASQRD